MRMRGVRLILLLTLCVATAPIARTVGFSTEFVVGGLSRPVAIASPPGDVDRIFIAEQHTGRIRILRLDDGVLEADPFLDLDGISSGNEQGLLGLAFHPNYAANGTFFVFITDPTLRVLSYRASADPNLADVSSRSSVISIPGLQPNHNGGWIDFGPDGFLYVAIGDGGGSDDNDIGHTPETGNAQDITDNLWGKLLRVDVDGDDFPLDPDRNYSIPSDNPFVDDVGDDEIWALGLRNPFRSSFDRMTGDLYIADVGQQRCEEINVQPAASGGGENYGWRLREGTTATQTGGVGGMRPLGAIDPIMDYPHAQTGELCSNPGADFVGAAVTGGYVYRGPISELNGRYIFADFSTAEIWSFRWDGSDPSGFDGTNYTELTNHSEDPRFIPDVGSIGSVSSFGEDHAGNLYVLDLFDGEVFQVPEPSRLILEAFALLTAAVAAGYRRHSLE
jgi:glucose/arabinose dehydrogenase